jgi:hypothetical protein
MTNVETAAEMLMRQRGTTHACIIIIIIIIITIIVTILTALFKLQNI